MSRTGRAAMLVMALTIGVLLICVSTSGAASLKMASACKTVQRTQQTSTIPIYQPLTGTQVAKATHYCKLARLSVNKLKYWDKHQNRWRLYPRHMKQKCWEIDGLKESVPTCIMARKQVREHTERFLKMIGKINQLTRPKLAKWLLANFTCIHGGEAAWDANTGNGYYGGLQMDLSFQNAYGPEFAARWGTANNWPIWAQLAAAARGYLARGFGPWPVTARNCGLL